MSNLSPPPLRDKELTSPAWQKWFSAVQLLLAPVSTGGLFFWNSVSKTGSNLTDLVTRNHSDLQNINSTTYSHLTSAQLTDLTDSGDSSLHYHATDRDRANHSGTQLAATISDFTSAADARVAVHVALADPHIQYQKETELNAASGYAGLNAVSRTTKGVDATDDLIIDLATKGLVLKDTAGTPHYWRLSVSTLGVITATDLGTTKP
jgi:hypothetical protein